MKTKDLIKELKGVFLLPRKTRYFGEVKFGTPYFEPRNYVGSIIKIRRLTLRSEKDRLERNKKYKYQKDQPSNIYSNYPIVRRANDKIVKVFGRDYYVAWGYPVSIKSTQLGWKDKFDSPRFEWTPQFSIYLFGLQYIVWWNAPILDGVVNNDKYYEMILWYLYYSHKDIQKAQETWGWVDMDTNQSTWDDRYIIER